MIQLDSSPYRRASIVEYPERNSLLILRAANGRVLREVIFSSGAPDSWHRAYRVLRHEAAMLGYEVQDDSPAGLRRPANDDVDYPPRAHGSSDHD